LGIASLRRAVNGDLRIEGVQQDLTSDGGLELLRRYLAHDPLVARLCGLARLPAERTVVNWLTQFTQAALQAVITLTSELLYEQIERLGLPRLTIDVDGTVIRTGGQVAWAFRGFNPHHRKDPSCYPLLAHLAQTGQILRLRNRPGSVHDSTGAVPFPRDLIRELRARFGRGLPLECRLEAACFQRELLTLLTRGGCEHAIQVGFWQWTGLKPLVAVRSKRDLQQRAAPHVYVRSRTLRVRRSSSRTDNADVSPCYALGPLACSVLVQRRDAPHRSLRGRR
jgi:hypothetical protein